ncbi:MAG: Crp/Fnr family transcriptional regulator [Burkholderiales bacterium]|jgi:CRP-like cAMP-binding protein|nr:Crp/Fnr family transcriptional regulator [Burkholderiales bacterium]
MTFLKITEGASHAFLKRLRAHAIFKDAPDDALLPLLQMSLVRRVPCAAFICRENDCVDFWWLLLEGELELVRHGTDGEERLFGRVVAGQLVAPILTFAPRGKTPVGYRARGDSVVLQMRRQDLRRLCEEIPKVAVALLEMASGNLIRRFEEIEFLTRGSAAQRLAAWLLREREAQGEKIELPMNQRQLAVSLGIRPETLNRLFADWQKLGYLEGRRLCWKIARPQALAAM